MEIACSTFGKLSQKSAIVLWLTAASLFTFVTRGYADMPTVNFGNGNIVKLEVASTDAEIARGLMFRTSLPEDCGMVFLFHPARSVSFWMYHTLISLDMCFVRDGKIIKLCQDVPPCRSQSADRCPTYPAEGPILVSEVIELKGGYARRHGIKEGDSLSFTIPGQSAATQEAK